MEKAEQVKRQYGISLTREVSDDDVFTIQGFGEDGPAQVSRKDLANIIEARVEEIFQLVLQEIKRSGYDGLLPAGMVLTGGSSLLPGMRTLASEVLQLPVRVARPENLLGLVDQLNSPAYSTSVGLLYWALMMSDTSLTAAPHGGRAKGAPMNVNINWDEVKNFLKRLLP
jgi:cell division protein FtsA